jgi:hypothetical protein
MLLMGLADPEVTLKAQQAAKHSRPHTVPLPPKSMLYAAFRPQMMMGMGISPPACFIVVWCVACSTLGRYSRLKHCWSSASPSLLPAPLR